VIRVVVGEIASVDADAVVRPTTTTLEPTTSVLRNLDRVGGPSFWEQLAVRVELAIGAAVVTDGGDLPTNFVIHAVIRSCDEQVSLTGVERALTSALQRAADWQLDRLAMPPLGTGAGNLKVEDVARVTTNVLEAHLKTQRFPTDVTIVVPTEEEKEVFDVWLKRLA
jgi:O-acetyl-ADP-ribose deacetylase (regulator of RNase III)